VEFGEWLCTDVLKYVPHRQWVFSIPKRLRIYFILPLKNPAASQQVSYAQIDLKLQPRRKKLILTTKPALVNRMIIVCVNWRLNMLGCS